MLSTITTYVLTLHRRLITRHMDKFVEALIGAAFERAFVILLEIAPHFVRVALASVLLVTGCDLGSHH